MIVKVCGLRDFTNTSEISALGVDMIGLNFYPKSKRYILENDVPKIKDLKILKAGVFVDASFEFIEDKVKKYGLNYIQLHGNENPQFCKKCKSLGQVIKAFGIASEEDLYKVDAYSNECDYFLFDYKSNEFGGAGKKFDWELLNKYDGSVPFLLAGGISADDVKEIKSITNPLFGGIDINSKFEISPAFKNVGMVDQFVREIKSIMIEKSYQNPDELGFYGEFGGAYIPEMLFANVEELRKIYLDTINDPEFKKEYINLLKDYVGRPSPLYYAKNLSERLNTNIFLKREDLNHTGAHKINNTIGQILIAKKLGKKRIIAETGAGQHGVATATVCALMGLDCVVYMGSVDIERQAPNVSRMQMLGATVVPAESGSKTLKDATNEAIRDWINNAETTHYIIGSAIGPHPYPDMVAKLQAIISEEIATQIEEKTGKDHPDYIVACVGGGSNAVGAFYHFLDDERVKLILAEAAGKGIDSGESAATSILGTKGIIHGCMTLLMQDPDGQVIEPYSLSAGLDYPGIGPIHAHLITQKRATVFAATDDEAMDAVYDLSAKEGIIPALESAHALAILDRVGFKEDDNVVVCLSGRGDKDLNTFINYKKSK